MRPSRHSSRRGSLLFCAVFTGLLIFQSAFLSNARADDTPSKVHALVGLEFSDKYLTPRGMIVADHGLTIQALALAFVNVYHDSPDAMLNDITFTPGFWNDYATSPIAAHTTPGGRKSGWVEYDPILGVSLGLAHHLKLDVTYTEFAMQILDIGTSQHLETKLSYDDSSDFGDYAVHPYVSYWKELSRKATAAANFGIPRSAYFEVGMAPGKAFGTTKLEIPLRVLLPNKNFYGQKFGSSSTVGLWEAGVKATSPLAFIPPGYGHWSGHLGYRYMKFVDKNLQQLSISGGFGNPKKDTGQIYAGVTSFF